MILTQTPIFVYSRNLKDEELSVRNYPYKAALLLKLKEPFHDFGL